MSTIGLSKPPMQSVLANKTLGDKATLPPQLEEKISQQAAPYTMLVFLRHTGCPFAEATIKHLKKEVQHTDSVHCIVVTHGDEQITKDWLDEIGGAEPLAWLHDRDRQLYGQWGIGYSNLRHMMKLSVIKAAFTLKHDGIINREATGTRWQQAGAFLLAADNTIVWIHDIKSANELPSIAQALATIGH